MQQTYENIFGSMVKLLYLFSFKLGLFCSKLKTSRYFLFSFSNNITKHLTKDLHNKESQTYKYDEIAKRRKVTFQRHDATHRDASSVN